MIYSSTPLSSLRISQAMNKLILQRSRSFCISRFPYHNRHNAICTYGIKASIKLVVFAKENGEILGVDFFVFGHRHYVLDLQIQNKKRVVILGDFVDNFSFGCFDGENFYMDEFQ